MPLGRQSHRHHRTHGQKHRRRGGRGKGASQGEEGLEALAHGNTLEGGQRPIVGRGGEAWEMQEEHSHVKSLSGVSNRKECF